MRKVLIADDHEVVRYGLRQLLADEPDEIVISEATTGQEVLERVGEQPWDVVLLDIALPGKSGLKLIKELCSLSPHLPVVVLSMHSEDQYAVRSFKSGASGYLTKESAPDQLIQAIRKVAAGGKYISIELAERLAFRLTLGTDDKTRHEALSNREFQVFRMLAIGKTVKEIADDLSLSIKTISTHRMRILEKMGVRTNADLTQYGIEYRLLDPQAV